MAATASATPVPQRPARGPGCASFIAKKTANLKTIDHLEGKTVACATGTSTMKRVRELSAARGLSLNILPDKDRAESMLLLTTGRADAAAQLDAELPDRRCLAARHRQADRFR